MAQENYDIQLTLYLRKRDFSSVRRFLEKGGKYLYDYFPGNDQKFNEKIIEEYTKAQVLQVQELEPFQFVLEIFSTKMVMCDGSKTTFVHNFNNYFMFFFLMCNIEIYQWIYNNKINNIDQELVYLCKNFPTDYASTLARHLIIFDFNNRKLLKLEKLSDFLKVGAPLDVIVWYNLILPFDENEFNSLQKHVEKCLKK